MSQRNMQLPHILNRVCAELFLQLLQSVPVLRLCVLRSGVRVVLRASKCVTLLSPSDFVKHHGLGDGKCQDLRVVLCELGL